MELKLVLAGLGGQGVIFTTRLLARTAVALGQSVMVSEVHGMSRSAGAKRRSFDVAQPTCCWR
jgi:indolepyruvate ferredoxin oxidoreductase beta subunit